MQRRRVTYTFVRPGRQTQEQKKEGKPWVKGLRIGSGGLETVKGKKHLQGDIHLEWVDGKLRCHNIGLRGTGLNDGGARMVEICREKNPVQTRNVYIYGHVPKDLKREAGRRVKRKPGLH